MDVASEPLTVGKRASVSDAKQAYFDGDFERSLAICANIRLSSVATASEVALLSARAYLRTGRPHEAQVTLTDTLGTHTSLDASLTAQMLLATARIRQDDADAGIAMLEDAATRSAGAHFSIRSEIALCTALGYWAKRDVDAAEAHLALVNPESDIIHARALELQAWCHTARREYRRSADYFRSTLVRLETCQAGDRAITATAISTLAILAAELFDRDIAAFVRVYSQRIDWSSGVAVQRYLMLLHQALFEEFAGDTLAAYRFAMQAHEAAPSVAFAAMGWASGSIIARNAGETFAAVTLARRAQELLGGTDIDVLAGEERFALLSVAESTAHADPGAAAALCGSYWGLAPVDKMLSLSNDPRLRGEEAFVSGVVAQGNGDLERAKTCFRSAFQTFREIGYVRRAVMSAYALIGLDASSRSSDGDAEFVAYVTDNLAGTSNYVTAGLAQPEINRPSSDQLAALERHPIVASLPRTQREVVTLICAGKTNKEIAALRNVGEQTIKNMLTKYVFRAFGVSSRSALVSLCLREAGSG